MARKRPKKSGPQRSKTPSRRKADSPARGGAHSAKRTPRLDAYHIDAFTNRIFHGNPAAVVLLDGTWLPDETLQSIAAENNLPMTAFVLRGKGKKLGLRWFNATREFELCGHATLAAAHALWNHEKLKGSSLVFSTKAGDIPAKRDADLITLEFPAMPFRKARVTNDLCAALGHEPSEVYEGKFLLAVFENKRDVHELAPDMHRLAALDCSGVIVTAPGAGHDFVSRFFAPKHGLNEDHATGSSHCLLVPYWSGRLGKPYLTSHQVSHRGGELWCALKANRVLLGGHAVTFGKGTITI